MNIKSIALIETESISVAMLAAEAVSKDNNVKIIKKIYLKTGITSIFIEGDLGALQKVVRDAEELVKDKGILRGAHIIPMPHPELISIFNFSKVS